LLPFYSTEAVRRDLPAEYFGEGIVDWGPNIYEWTWKSHVCFVYDRLSLRPVKQFTYSGEGWGMTRTRKELITSDGTATLRFRDPNTFQETRHIVVKEGSIIVDRLNELEFIMTPLLATQENCRCVPTLLILKLLAPTVSPPIGFPPSHPLESPRYPIQRACAHRNEARA
jgi:hypothetical protein